MAARSSTGFWATSVTPTARPGSAARGISCADYEHVLASHGMRFRDRAVEDPLAHQSLQRGDGQPLVGNAGRQHHGAADDLTAVGQRRDAVASLCTQTGDRLGVDDLCTELDGLIGGTGRKILAADATREAEVVADHGAGSRLATDGLRLDDDRLQSFRCGVDRSS